MPVCRAQEDPPEVYPKPGDPGTRTVRLYAASGSKVADVAVEYHSDHDALMMGGRLFLPTWRGDGTSFVEKQYLRCQGHA